MTKYGKFAEFFEERERFRSFAFDHDFHRDIEIDSSNYANLSCIDGCFCNGETCIVYSTDEKRNVYFEREYTRPIDAFREVAKRQGFEYTHKISLEQKGRRI